MKPLKFAIIAAAAATISLQACHSNKDSKATADSINKANDTTKTDTTKTAMPLTVDEKDAKFAVEAANGGMTEVMVSKLAQDKGSEKVKSFAAMMVTDHSKANDELMALAKSKNITLPSVVSADKQKEFDDLSKKTGADFDKAYVKAMVDGHKKTVDLFEDGSKNLKDADLKAFATKTLPTLKMHKDAIDKINSGLK